ncbi:hypothetical protein K9M18_05035 [Candidatus Woesearchaeota archaeon]|nr:hypothetical protein [Candidatus Woesearchaeota archaeon]
MENLKTFEGYIDDKIKSLKKLKKFIDFMEKYKLKYFTIGDTDPDENYQFEYIEKTSDGYEIEYVDYTQGDSKDITCGLLELPNNVVDALFVTCDDGHRFTIEYHLEMIAGNIDEFIEVLKIHKEPIKFSTWIFGLILENDQQERGNSFEFQDILFSTHPEAYKSFIDECFDSLVRSKKHNFEPLKVNPKILKKYKNLLGEYYHKKQVEYEAGKYNL